MGCAQSKKDGSRASDVPYDSAPLKASSFSSIGAPAPAAALAANVEDRAQTKKERMDSRRETMLQKATSDDTSGTHIKGAPPPRRTGGSVDGTVNGIPGMWDLRGAPASAAAAGGGGRRGSAQLGRCSMGEGNARFSVAPDMIADCQALLSEEESWRNSLERRERSRRAWSALEDLEEADFVAEQRTAIEVLRFKRRKPATFEAVRASYRISSLIRRSIGAAGDGPHDGGGTGSTKVIGERASGLIERMSKAMKNKSCEESVPPPDESYTGPQPHDPPTEQDMLDMLDYFIKAPIAAKAKAKAAPAKPSPPPAAKGGGPMGGGPKGMPAPSAATMELKNPPLLHEHYVLKILNAVKDQVLKEDLPAVRDIESPPDDSRLFVIGDTHGQLQDVLWIFTEYGPPSATNRYLFNGDVADRGESACEIFMLLFGFMLAVPGSVILTRGNHECASMNERPRKNGGGFAEELRSKFPSPAGTKPRVFHFFTEKIYPRLPVGVVVGGSALVVHGGLSRHRNVHLAHLRQIDVAESIVPEAPTTYDEYLFFDSLWSDPHPTANGVHLQSSRGDGCIRFGADVTHAFLKRNRLQLLIRSHQLPASGRGYAVQHEGRCITVFSASNYDKVASNTGAVLQWSSGKIELHEFTAPSPMELAAARVSDDAKAKLRAAKAAAANANALLAKAGGPALPPSDALDGDDGEVSGVAALMQRCSSRGEKWTDKHKKSDRESETEAGDDLSLALDDEVVRMLKERVLRCKPALRAAFQELPGHSEPGVITVEHWAETCSKVLKLDLDWDYYQPWIVDLTPSGGIDYEEAFLMRYEIALPPELSGWQTQLLQRFYDTLVGANLERDELIELFDTDGDGMVTLSECTAVLGQLELGLSPAQEVALARSLVFSNQTDAGNKAGTRKSAGVSPGGNQKGGGGSEEPSEPMIAVSEYFSRLAIHAGNTHIEGRQELEELVGWLQSIARTKHETIAELFEEWDGDGASAAAEPEARVSWSRTGGP